jgi:hypothetical protein
VTLVAILQILDGLWGLASGCALLAGGTTSTCVGNPIATAHVPMDTAFSIAASGVVAAAGNWLTSTPSLFAIAMAWRASRTTGSTRARAV